VKKQSSASSTRTATDYVYTRSGKAIYPEEMTADEVDIWDIAQGLSRIMRYNGQTNISVLRHSLGIANWMKEIGHSDSVVEFALLHDAPEAYMMDVPKPLQRFMSKAWHETYNHVEKTILASLGIDSVSRSIRESVKLYDVMVVEYEMDWGIMNQSSRMSFPKRRDLSLSDINRIREYYRWDLGEVSLVDEWVKMTLKLTDEQLSRL
jgi:hypothetical protein